MGRYRKGGYQTRSTVRPWKVHPIWRGIGCLLIILVPVISYAGAVLLVEANRQAKWMTVPAELMRTISIPTLSLKIPHLWANLLAAAVLALLGFGVVMIIYAIIYSIIGPDKYSPLDSPPVRRPSKPTWKK